MAWVIDKGEWLKLYEEIKSALPLSFDKDQYATDILSILLQRHPGRVRLEEVPSIGRPVVIFGCGRNLADDIRVYLDRYTDYPAIAADGSVKELLDHGILPLIVVTDLDGDPRSIQKAAREGSLIIVHAHGDNIDRVRGLVESIQGRLLGSTQVEPRPYVYNFGGFTDGDRAVFIARALGSGRVILAGFDFENPSACETDLVKKPWVKKLKLEVARRLLEYLSSKGMEIEFIQ